jgi:hypothetical protein
MLVYRFERGMDQEDYDAISWTETTWRVGASYAFATDGPPLGAEASLGLVGASLGLL